MFSDGSDLSDALEQLARVKQHAELRRAIRIAVDLVINPVGWKDAAFAQLATQKAEIERDVGSSLDFREMPEKDSSRIVLVAEIDPSIDSNRQRVADWFAEMAPKLFVALQTRIRKLEAPTEQL